MENLLISLNCVAPVFIYLVCGYYARQRRIVPQSVFPQINTLSVHVLLPMLVINNIYNADYSKAVSPRLLMFSVFGTLAFFILGYILIPFVTKDVRLQGAYLQNSFRSNIGIIAITLAELLMDADGLAAATIAIAMMIPIYNVLAVLSFEVYRNRGIHLKGSLLSILKNPIIIATMIGLLLVVFRISLPASVRQSIAFLGKTGSTLALLTLGASFDFSNLRANRRRVVFGTLTRLVIVPALAMLCAVALNFRGNDLTAIFLMFSSPLATTGFTMAQVYDADAETTGQIVIASTLLSCLTFFLGIFLLKECGLI